MNSISLPPIEHQAIIVEWIHALEYEAQSGRISESTLHTYRSALLSPNGWIRTVQKLGRDPNPLDVYEYISNLAKNHSPVTCNKILSAIKSCYAWMETRGKFRNIGSGMKSLKTFRDGPLPAFSRDQVKSMLEASLPASIRTLLPDSLKWVMQSRDDAFIRILYATGLRLISMSRMDVQDVKPDGDRLVILHQPKGHTAKDMPAIVPPKAAQAWLAYMSARAQASIGSDAAWISVWPKPGGRLSMKSMRQIITTRADRIGVRKRGEDGKLAWPRVYGPHAMRRAASVDVIEQHGLEAGQVLLGHAHADQTRRSYARVQNFKILQEVANGLDL